MRSSGCPPGLTGAVNDFPQSPDVISEFQVLTSNYDAQYGSAGGVTIENVKSGTNNYHGTVFEFHRDSALNAVQWGIGAADKRGPDQPGQTYLADLLPDHGNYLFSV